ncbi:phosphopentomutase/phosphoglucosamine mutase [Halovivax cerinus]|uniref:Phosphopentomutase/phosphoglucosamine mutase n=1 Tax=Halovivax cerinus TaxID=1487865 RepID=A0ABD5NK64_9EURY|nr:phosphopentomutase/phosphoglucosamine mutase [Halovivax cerinus]
MALFGTSGVRGPVGDAVTAELALSVGRAVGVDADRVVVGRDVRETGDLLVDAVAAGLRESGTDVVDVGVATTPTIARSVGWRHADRGIAVTASHNPPADNGLKLWDETGKALDRDSLATIERRIEHDETALVAWDDVGDRVTWSEAIDQHVEAIVDAVDRSAEVSASDAASIADPLSVVVDVGSGTGSITATALRELGYHVDTLNALPDGRFPARPSEPTAETCATLARVVETTDADLGVAHDGDADRLLAVADDGTVVDGDVLLALFGRDAVERAGEDDPDLDAGPADAGAVAASGDGHPLVAAPVNTSLAVDDALSEVGAGLTRTRVGDGYVAERAADPAVVFGGEPSGAWIWPDETPCPDGPLAACRLAALVTRDGPLSELAADVPSYPIHRASVETEEKGGVVESLAASIADGAGPEPIESTDDRDGLRVDLGDAWYLLRASGTQPLVRITAQARDDDRAKDVFESARELVTDAVENNFDGS